jgi:hypothetical protein
MNKHENDESIMAEWNRQSQRDLQAIDHYSTLFDQAPGTSFGKLECFSRFVRRQRLSKFLAHADIFRRIVDVHGSILDLGVNSGQSLFTWAHLSAILEPVNYTREIIGFDTFEGIPEVTAEDVTGESPSLHLKKGGFAYNHVESFKDSIDAFDSNRFIGQIQKIRLVQGDITETLPKFITENQHLVVSLMHLDMDVYKPTRVALECVVPRMPKGAMIVFDQVNQIPYPGETKALADVLGISNVRLQRVQWDTGLSFAVVE